MAGTVDYVRKTLETSYALIKARAQAIFVDLLKIGVAEALVGLAALLLIGGMAYVILGASIIQMATSGTIAPALMQNLAIGMAIAIPIIIIVVLADGVLKSVAFNIIDNASAGKPTDLMGCARKNLLPIVKLSVLTWAVMLVLAVPVILSVMIGSGNPDNVLQTLALLCIIPFIFAAVFVIFMFMIQFSTIEVVLNGKGPIEALKASASLVRGNIWGVILVDAVIAVVGMALSVISSIATSILRIVMQVFSAGGTAGMAVGFATYIIGIVLVGSVIGALIGTVTMPVIYNFWKGKKV